MFTSTDNAVVLPGFTRVDAAVFFNLTPSVRAQVNVENLFDEDYYAIGAQQHQHHAGLAACGAVRVDDAVLSRHLGLIMQAGPGAS